MPMGSPLWRWFCPSTPTIGAAHPGAEINGRDIARFARRASWAGQDICWLAEFTPSEVTPMLMLVPMAT